MLTKMEKWQMVIVRIWEGLGNQMFQYAYARALKEKGIDVRIDLNKAYDEAFEKYRNNAKRENQIQNFRISLPSIDMNQYGKYKYLSKDTWIKRSIFCLQNYSLWKYKFYEEQIQGYSDKSAEIKGNYYVKGWFQSERYFRDIRNILLKEFIPKEKIRISKKLHEVLEDPKSVSLHVRRGDYVKVNIALDTMYYERAIDYIGNNYENPIFVIFSDDLEWVKENIHINGKCIFVNEDKKLKDYEELFIMSRCRTNIISNSTFSWWAAWLNQNEDKRVIAPRKWIEGQKGIVPKDWMVL